VTVKLEKSVSLNWRWRGSSIFLTVGTGVTIHPTGILPVRSSAGSGIESHNVEIYVTIRGTKHLGVGSHEMRRMTAGNVERRMRVAFLLRPFSSHLCYRCAYCHRH
jgi:hypothetical protein